MFERQKTIQREVKKMSVCPICNNNFKRLDMHLGNAHGKELLDKAGYKPNDEVKNYEQKPKISELERQTQTTENITGIHRPANRTPLTQIKEMMIEQNELLMLQVQQKALMQQLNQQTEKPTDHTLEMFKIQREMIRDEQDRQEKQKKELLETLKTEGASPFESIFTSMLLGGINNGNNKNDKPISDTVTGYKEYPANITEQTSTDRTPTQ